MNPFTREILGPASFPVIVGQDLPDPVGVPLPKAVALPENSREVSQGWGKLTSYIVSEADALPKEP